MDRLVFIERIRFLFYDNIRIRYYEVPVVKGNMANNSKSVGDNARLGNITKMSTDVKLSDFRTSRNMGRHSTIRSFTRIIRSIIALEFGISPKLLDNPACVLRIIFSDKSFNFRRVKNGHISFGGINNLTDWPRKIHKMLEHGLQIIREILFKSSDFRGIRNFIKTAEIMKRFGVCKKDQQELVSRNRKSTLNNQGP